MDESKKYVLISGDEECEDKVRLDYTKEEIKALARNEITFDDFLKNSRDDELSVYVNVEEKYDVTLEDFLQGLMNCRKQTFYDATSYFYLFRGSDSVFFNLPEFDDKDFLFEKPFDFVYFASRDLTSYGKEYFNN